MHIHERTGEKKRLNALMLKSPMKVYTAFAELGRKVYADGALSKKHKELMALAVAVSQNCFD
jgi:alkylhydroperoxidase/carboxymuconolactone decarboxylase family protein YurZ